MQKINFQNLPSTSTPVNATNLNAIQTNVENVFNGTEPMGNIIVDSIKSKNMFNINTVSLGYQLDADGTLSSRNDYMVSDYIEVNANTDYYLSNVSGGTRVRTCAFYNSSKTFLSIQSIAGSETASGEITTPNDARYMRICSYAGNSNIQVERGNTSTDYAEYKGIGYVSGENSNGNYVKYDDGRLECWANINLGALSFSASGNMYLANYTNGIDFPIEFIDAPVISINTQHTGDYAWSNIYAVERNNKKISRVGLLRTSQSSSNVYVGYHAIGRWK